MAGKSEKIPSIINKLRGIVKKAYDRHIINKNPALKTHKSVESNNDVDFKAYGNTEAENIEFKMKKTNTSNITHYSISCSNARRLKKLLESHLLNNYTDDKKSIEIQLNDNKLENLIKSNIIETDYFYLIPLKDDKYIHIIDFINKNFYIKDYTIPKDKTTNKYIYIKCKFNDIVIEEDEDCSIDELNKKPVSIKYGKDPKDHILIGSLSDYRQVPYDCRQYITCSEAIRLKHTLITKLQSIINTEIIDISDEKIKTQVVIRKFKIMCYITYINIKEKTFRYERYDPEKKYKKYESSYIDFNQLCIIKDFEDHPIILDDTCYTELEKTPS
jgi:hypothetical protein